MKKQTLAITIPALAIVLGLSQSCLSHDETRERATRIGVYDSRAVAVAFSGSPAHEAQLAELHTALREAEETGGAASQRGARRAKP